MQAIRLVTFDALGTLLYFKENPLQIYSTFASQHNIHVDPKLIAKSFKTAFKQANDQWPNFGSYHKITSEDWWKKVIHNTFQSELQTNNSLEPLSQQLFKFFTTDRAYGDYPFSKDMLNILRNKHNVKTGIISNTDERLHQVLKSLHLYKHFDFVLTSKEVGFEKPRNEIFEHALQLAGVVGE